MNWNDFYNNLLLKVGQLISGYNAVVYVMQNGRSGGGGKRLKLDKIHRNRYSLVKNCFRVSILK